MRIADQGTRDPDPHFAPVLVQVPFFKGGAGYLPRQGPADEFSTDLRVFRMGGIVNGFGEHLLGGVTEHIAERAVHPAVLCLVLTRQ